MNLDSKQFKNYCMYVYSSNYFCILDSSTEVLKLFETAPPFMIATEPYKKHKILRIKTKKSPQFDSVLDFSTTVPKLYCSLKKKTSPIIAVGLCRSRKFLIFPKFLISQSEKFWFFPNIFLSLSEK